jgi:hypothetical protein
MKNLGPQSFCPGSRHAHRYMQKVAMPCPAHGLAGFSRFFAEAVLLTEGFTFLSVSAGSLAE